MRARLTKLKEKRQRVAAAPTAINPMEVIANNRREFYTSLLDKIQTLTGPLPDHILQDIRAYATPTPSERGLLQLTDCTAEEIRAVLETLLEPAHLSSLQLATTLKKLLDTMRHQVVVGHTTASLNPEEKARFLIKEYVKKNLSSYMTDRPEDAEPTDTPFPRMKKELDVLFGWNNPLFTLLETKIIPEADIKQFLANSDFETPDGKTNIRYAVHKFIRTHRFDPIRQLFQTGFVPTQDSDWEQALPEEYYKEFPKVLWKMRNKEEFERFAKSAEKFSLALHDMVRFSTYAGLQIPMLGGVEEHKTAAVAQPKKKPKPKFIVFPNTAKLDLLQRNRPWVEGMVSVLLQPISPIGEYIGEPLQRTGYFFPNDSFYKDLALVEKAGQHQGADGVFSITNHQGLTKKMRLAHWMRDGQVVPQTPSLFEKGWKWMERDRSVVVPNAHNFFLHLDLHALSQSDMDFITRKVRSDMTAFLSAVFHEKLDLDRIVAEIEEGIRNDSITLSDYLINAFHVMVLIDPRYNLKSILGSYFPTIAERFRLFLYKLPSLHKLPIPFFYPQYPFVDQIDRMRFNTWFQKMGEHFATSHVVSLLHSQYPDLRVTETHKMPTHLLPPSSLEMPTGFPPEKAAFFLPYKEEFVWLPNVASSILHQEELLVHDKPLDKEFAHLVAEHFQLDRAEKGIAAMFLDNGYEMEDDSTVSKTDNASLSTSIQSSSEENLPGFKSKAFEFLQSLRQ